MGLDMYLYARRNLPEEFGLTIEQRQRYADGDEGFFVHDYDYAKGNEGAQIYVAAVTAAGLSEAIDLNTPVAYIVSDEDNERDAWALKAAIGYWRKANQIHAWFVEHVQGGEDECNPHDVSREQLEELREVCRRVLGASKAEDGLINVGWTTDGADPDTDLGHGPGWRPITEEGKMVVDSSVAEAELPTTQGFFFGGTDYDEWYLRDLENTILIIDRALALPDDVTFIYRSSW